MPDRDVKTIHDLIYPVRKSRRLLSMVDSYDRLRHKAMIIRYLFSNGVNYHYTKIIARRAFSAQDGKAAKAKRVQSAEFRVQSVGATLNGKYCADCSRRSWRRNTSRSSIAVTMRGDACQERHRRRRRNNHPRYRFYFALAETTRI